MHTHAGSKLHNRDRDHITTLWWGLAIEYVFGVHGSSHFSFTARPHRQTDRQTDRQSHKRHGSPYSIARLSPAWVMSERCERWLEWPWARRRRADGWRWGRWVWSRAERHAPTPAGTAHEHHWSLPPSPSLLSPSRLFTQQAAHS